MGEFFSSLMSWEWVRNREFTIRIQTKTYLFESLVVDEAGGILGDLKLLLLDLLAELPSMGVSNSAVSIHGVYLGWSYI
jgi:hypothetical protein